MTRNGLGIEATFALLHGSDTLLRDLPSVLSRTEIFLRMID